MILTASERPSLCRRLQKVRGCSPGPSLILSLGGSTPTAQSRPSSRLVNGEVAGTAVALFTVYARDLMPADSSALYVGFQQQGQNQNPVFARFDGGSLRYCEHHEEEAPDGRAYGVTWDGGATAFVVYTIAGGGSAFDDKARGKWLDHYGDGGGSSKVAYIGEVDTASGDLRAGTFVIAKKMDGKTNSHKPADAILFLDDGRLELHGDSAFQPMNPDKSLMDCTDYPFHTKYVFSGDLVTLTCSSSTNCTSNAECE